MAAILSSRFYHRYGTLKRRSSWCNQNTSALSAESDEPCGRLSPPTQPTASSDEYKSGQVCTLDPQLRSPHHSFIGTVRLVTAPLLDVIPNCFIHELHHVQVHDLLHCCCCSLHGFCSLRSCRQEDPNRVGLKFGWDKYGILTRNSLPPGSTPMYKYNPDLPFHVLKRSPIV